MVAISFEIQHGVDHVLDHLRAGNLTILGHVSDQQQGTARGLGMPDEGMSGRTYLAHGAGRGFDGLGPKSLNGIDDDEVGAFAVLQRCEDTGKIGFTGERHGCVGKAEPLSSQPYLCGSFLARKVDRVASCAGELGRKLQNQR